MTYSPFPPPSSLTHACRPSSELRRRHQREERKDRLASQVTSMKGRLREQDEQEASGDVAVTSELSVPWLVLGFAVMVGYCFYYLFS